MKLAEDLNEFISKYGKSLADAADSILKPVIDPAVDPMPDLSDLEAHRSKLTDKKFKFFPSQVEKIAGLVEGLKRHNRTWLIAEMASGKSPMSLAAMHLQFKGKRKYTAIVMCPGHIVKKWRREIRWLVPNVHCEIVKKFHELTSFVDKAKQWHGPSIMVISKESAKLGFQYGKPAASTKKASIQIFLDSREEMLPTDFGFKERSNISWWNVKYNKEQQYEARRIVDVIACPTCGKTLAPDGSVSETPMLHDDYVRKDVLVSCENCGDTLSTNARGFRKNPHLDKYIQRHCKGLFDLLIADEVHELAGSETAQGNTFGTLASACKYTMALTGTLIGGKAVDLHAPLWRVSPDLMRRHGFDLRPLKGGKIGAIGRNAKTFTGRYGVLEHEIVRQVDAGYGRVYRGRSSRRKQYKTPEKIRPGISPDLYNHFLCGRAVFMSLAELGPALPTIERILEPCSVSDELRSEYDRIDNGITTYLKTKRSRGPHCLAGIRVMALDAYLDRPWSWDPITAPIYDADGLRMGDELVVQPGDLGVDYSDSKDERLVQVCKSELDQGRRCCVYPLFTAKHDVRGKMKSMLEEAGLKAVILPDSVKPVDREEWIEKNVDKIEVLIVHPKRVMTGLDLVQFPTLVWYQLGYSTHVLRQASARARRPIQTLPCKVIFLYYEGTIQEQALHLMGEKEAASQSLEGKFDTRGLKALMNGGENDDIMVALSQGLKRGIDPSAAWGEVDKVENPFRQEVTSIPEVDLPLLSLLGKSTSDPEHCSTSSKTTSHEELPLFSLVS